VGHAPLQGDVGVADLARQLPDVRRVAALAVLDHFDVRAEPADVGEAGLDDPVDLDQEPKVLVRISHRSLLSVTDGRLVPQPPVICWMRKMTNSAGLTIATPISVT